MFGKKEKVIVSSCVYNCLREKCPKWVELFHTEIDEKGNPKTIKEGRCADNWTAFLLAELAGVLRDGVSKEGSSSKRDGAGCK